MDYRNSCGAKPACKWCFDQDVVNGIMSVRRVALEYNVPKLMLHDRVTARMCQIRNNIRTLAVFE